MPTLREHRVNFKHDLDELISELQSYSVAQVVTVNKLRESIEGIKTILGRETIELDEILLIRSQSEFQPQYLNRPPSGLGAHANEQTSSDLDPSCTVRLERQASGP